MDKLRKAAVMTGIDKMNIERIPMPVLSDPDDVLINIKSVGICGSDIHYFKEGKIGTRVVKPPHILGHECAGVIAAVGSNVTSLKIGDRVAVEPSKPCGKCEFCMKGKYNLCTDMLFMAAPHPFKHSEGAFSEYSVRPANFCFKIPDHVTFEEAAMAEPLAVALQALKRGRVSAGQTIAIIGCGPIALCVLLSAKAYGCSTIYMSDVVDYRLDYAMKLGAYKVFNAASVDYVSEILKETEGRGVDVVIDTTGSEKAYPAAVDLVMRGGVIVLVGNGVNRIVPFNVGAVLDKELDVVGVFRYDNIYRKAIDLIASGAVDLKKIITHRYPVEDITEAFSVT